MMNNLKLIKSRELGQVLCEMFGLDPRSVIDLEVKCGGDSVATVRVNMYIRTENGKLILDGEGVKLEYKKFVLKEE